ncbi:MAG: response regulator [Planctomycetota bacterium]
MDSEGTYTYVSPKVKELLGYEPEEVIGKTPFDLMPPEEAKRVGAIFRDIVSSHQPIERLENVNLHKDGQSVVLETNGMPIFDVDGTFRGYRGIDRDITGRKQMEERVLQMEKMEAIGQLAGGIAHDFNNQLAGILGFAELLLGGVESEKLRAYAQQVVKSAHRAADLTKQLLAFARKGRYQSVVVDIHKTLADVVAFLQHSIDKRIVVKQSFRADPSGVLGDPTQLQNAFLNIALNARDAEPEGGEIHFATDVVTLDDAYCRDRPYEILPGEYIRISVTDSGVGMDAETQKHIFEPSFTTKKLGEGIGMGLAAVYGTVKNHRGAVSVYSEPGRGTTFTVFLPLVEAKERPAGTDSKVIPARKAARILVADDEETVRNVAVEMLQKLGYEVAACPDGAKALERYRAAWQEIDLVILDMVMPNLSGRDTFRAMRKINPRVKVLLSSGYSVNGEAQEILNQGALGFLQKPFTTIELSQKVADVLSHRG